MGMDIWFNKEKAVTAGMRLLTVTNGTPEEIKNAESEEERNWLSEERTIIEVPYAHHYITIEEYDGTLIGRANPWGMTYTPLTRWLTENRIPWEESC